MNTILATLAMFAATAGGTTAPPAPNKTLIPVNINCGIPPIPPIGCKVGACMCDQSGRHCEWTFVCN